MVLSQYRHTSSKLLIPLPESAVRALRAGEKELSGKLYLSYHYHILLLIFAENNLNYLSL